MCLADNSIEWFYPKIVIRINGSIMVLVQKPYRTAKLGAVGESLLLVQQAAH